jgi:hypothetical protein
VVEQLGERVLEERQGAGTVADVGHDLGDQARLEANAQPFGGSVDGAFEFLRGHRRDHLGAAAQQLTDGPVIERTVV